MPYDNFIVNQYDKRRDQMSLTYGDKVTEDRNIFEVIFDARRLNTQTRNIPIEDIQTSSIYY